MTSISVKSDSLSVSVYLITRDQQMQNPGHWLELIMGASYLQGDDKTSFSSSKGTIFGLPASKRDNRQQIPIPFRTVLSKRYHGLGKGFSSERTIYWQPAFKGRSFPLFKTLFQKMKSALPAAIKWPQGRYFHKGSITEHAFHFKLPTGSSVNKK